MEAALVFWGDVMVTCKRLHKYMSRISLKINTFNIRKIQYQTIIKLLRTMGRKNRQISLKSHTFNTNILNRLYAAQIKKAA